MSVGLLGFGFGFFGQDRGLGRSLTGARKGLDGVTESTEGLNRVCERGTFFEKFKQSFRDLHLIEMANQLAGLAGETTGVSDSLDALAASNAKTLNPMIARMGQLGQGAMKGVGGIAYGLGVDIGTVAKGAAELRETGTDLQKVFGKGFGLSTLAKVAEVSGTSTDALVQTVHNLRKSWGMSEQQAGSFMDSMVSYGQQARIGSASTAKMREQVALFDTTLKTHGMAAAPEDLQRYSKSIFAVAGMFRQTGSSADGALASANKMFESMATENENIKKMQMGIGDGYGPMTVAMLQAGYTIEQASELMKKNDPMAMARSLNQRFLEIKKNDPTLQGEQALGWGRFKDVLSQTVPELGMMVTANNVTTASFDKQADAMKTVDGALKKLGKGFSTGRTLQEELERAQLSFSHSVKSIAAPEIGRFVNGQIKGYGDAGKALTGFVAKGGPMGQLLKTIVQVGHVGPLALLPLTGMSQKAAGEIAAIAQASGKFAVDSLKTVGDLAIKGQALVAPVAAIGNTLFGWVSPWVLIGAAAVGAFVLIRKHWDTIGPIVAAASEKIRNGFNVATDWVAEVDWGAKGKWFAESLIDMVGKAFTFLVKAMHEGEGFMQKVVNVVTGKDGTFGMMLKADSNTLGGSIVGFVVAVIKGMSDFGSAVTKALREQFATMNWTSVAGDVGHMAGFAFSTFSYTGIAVSWSSRLFGAFRESLAKDGAEVSFGDAVKTLITKGFGYAIQGVNFVKMLVGSVSDMVTGKSGSSLDGALTSVQGPAAAAFDGFLKGVFGITFEQMKTNLASMDWGATWGVIKKGLSDTWNALGGIWDAAQPMFASIGGAVKKWVGEVDWAGIWVAIKDAFSSAFTTGGAVASLPGLFGYSDWKSLVSAMAAGFREIVIPLVTVLTNAMSDGIVEITAWMKEPASPEMKALGEALKKFGSAIGGLIWEGVKEHPLAAAMIGAVVMPGAAAAVAGGAIRSVVGVGAGMAGAAAPASTGMLGSAGAWVGGGIAAGTKAIVAGGAFGVGGTGAGAAAGTLGTAAATTVAAAVLAGVAAGGLIGAGVNRSMGISTGLKFWDYNLTDDEADRRRNAQRLTYAQGGHPDPLGRGYSDFAEGKAAYNAWQKYNKDNDAITSAAFDRHFAQQDAAAKLFTGAVAAVRMPQIPTVADAIAASQTASTALLAQVNTAAVGYLEKYKGSIGTLDAFATSIVEGNKADVAARVKALTSVWAGLTASLSGVASSLTSTFTTAFGSIGDAAKTLGKSAGDVAKGWLDDLLGKKSNPIGPAGKKGVGKETPGFFDGLFTDKPESKPVTIPVVPARPGLPKLVTPVAPTVDTSNRAKGANVSGRDETATRTNELIASMKAGGAGVGKDFLYLGTEMRLQTMALVNELGGIRSVLDTGGQTRAKAYASVRGN